MVEIIEVRELSAEFVSKFQNLIRQLSKTAPAPTEQDLYNIVNSQCTRLLIARDGDKLLGSLSLVLFRIPTGLRAWIEDLVVDEANRNNGVGTELVQYAICLASLEGARTVDLTSRPERDAANRLYIRLGFSDRKTNVYRLTPKSQRVST